MAPRTLSTALAASLLVTTSGCYEVAGFSDLEFAEQSATGPSFEQVVALERSPTPKLDVLLVIDNSRSMADKQQALGQSLATLLSDLANPWCLDLRGASEPVKPAGPHEPCPDGMYRQVEPVVDMHLGVISSSLGDQGGDVCPDEAPSADHDDHGRLLTRYGAAEPVATYQDLGFLAWDPAQQLSPPGEDDHEALARDLAGLIGGAGERGCGFEATLESWYRFLVDPEPYLRVEVRDDQAVLEGVDQVLLDQRRDFLRDDSLVLIIMLSDENDCSINPYGANHLVATQWRGAEPYHLPPGRSKCLEDPLHLCCKSCAESVHESCDEPDPICVAPLDAASDPIGLRCFDQRRRFGKSFLHRIERYVDGLTSRSVERRDGSLVSNPLFPWVDEQDKELGWTRDERMVVLAGIVGVPWQDIARRADDDTPDLLAGLDDRGWAVGGYQSYAEMEARGTWDLILGDPDGNRSPQDPLMRESVDARDGTHPVTGDAIAPPGAGYLANSINGHERSNPARDDLQYACIYPLASPRDCSAGSTEPSCYCSPADTTGEPLCQAPDGSYGDTQYFAKAYPGLRQLQVLRALGPRGVVGSICPAQTENPIRADFGYQPMLRALIEAVQLRLQSDPCVADPRPADEQGRIGCAVVEAREVGAEPCLCDRRQYRDSIATACPSCEALLAPIALEPAYQDACFCAVEQCSGSDCLACRTQSEEPVVNAEHGQVVEGWCYVDPAEFVDSQDLVASCPRDSKHRIRFLGSAQPDPSAALFLVCP
ncbi:MAG: hypothetical protein JRI23_33820 [Deltaproteobacteria bacterium]|jgi:hypothetical protein|nr:hypothetical protein [Deltaproteobacteria bacterium]MBW2537271.1 hypothetical protein [Deltaproteobacteria bacterium]